MEFKEFCEQIQDEILSHLPEEYRDSTVRIQEVVKSGDQHKTGLLISQENEVVTPNIYLEGYFEQYQDGMSMNAILNDIADNRVAAAVRGQDIFLDDFMGMVKDYEMAKDHLQVRLCDPERNSERLQSLAYTMEGDFAATYHLVLNEIPSVGAGSIALTKDMLKNWSVPILQVKADALRCDLERTPTLMDINSLVGNLAGFFAGEPENLFQKQDAMMDGPMYVLSNAESINGAALMLQPDLMERIGEMVGGDYYVLPSSVHEALIVPDRSGVSREELSEMVRNVNETQVTPEEFLSNEVQYYDTGMHLMMNAEQHEMLQSRSPMSKEMSL